MTILTISIAQINIQPNKFEKNVELVFDLIDSLETYDNHFLLLPELWSSGFTPELQISFTKNQALFDKLIEISDQKNLNIIGSYIQRNKNSEFTNQLILISSSSGLAVRYDKIHLFSQMNEKKWFINGIKPSIYCDRETRAGFAICYDLRFPEHFRFYAEHNVNICFIPSQWPEKRIDHFVTLTKARAIENQFFVVTSNVVGHIGNTYFGGESSLFSPNGERLINAGKKVNQIFTTKIDLKQVEEIRRDFPVINDIKQDCYY